MMVITLISLILSVFLGGIMVSLLKKSNKDQGIKFLLAFSGGFLLSIGFIHFIPELYEHSHGEIGFFILIGFLIQLILEFFSGGIEHGHIHHHSKKIPYGIIIALSIHAFIEGIPLGSQFNGAEIATSHHHHENDNSLLLGIIIHRIPVAIALATLLLNSGIGQLKSWIILSLFAIVTPFGMFLGYYGLSSGIAVDLNAILAIVVGMFLHISTTIIFETSENHKFNFIKLIMILGGGFLAYFIH